MTDYAPLKAAAEAATPGPWRHWGPKGDGACKNWVDGPSLGYDQDYLREADAAFIVTASPDVILALLADLDTAVMVTIEAKEITRELRMAEARYEALAEKWRAEIEAERQRAEDMFATQGGNWEAHHRETYGISTWIAGRTADADELDAARKGAGDG